MDQNRQEPDTVSVVAESDNGQASNKKWDGGVRAGHLLLRYSVHCGTFRARINTT